MQVEPIKNPDDPALKEGDSAIVFSLSDCKPCEQLMAMLSQAEENPDRSIRLRKLEYDMKTAWMRALVRKYRVRSYPCVLLLRDGEILHKAFGYNPDLTLDEQYFVCFDFE